MAAIKTNNMNNLYKTTPKINKNCYAESHEGYLPVFEKTVMENIDQKIIDNPIVDNKCDECINHWDQNMNNRLSEVQQFYYKKNVFITGATGFLGKMIVEKLLRSCPGVENLYLLVRQKRGKDIYTRMDEIFEDPVFDKVKEIVPKFRHKIVLIPGDCETAGLGITLTDRQMLTEKVNIIFHSAATVKFDEHLRAALQTNVGAPLHLLRLARDIKDLDVFMHVSTAYSNSHLPRIEEKFYPCSADSEQIRTVIDKLTDNEIDQMLPKILGPWPNTYTFTKALAEKDLLKNSKNVPLGIFRPAIITSTYKEPLRCWLDNMYGPTGVAVGGCTGILRVLQCDQSITADIVPVDYVVNCLLIAAYNVHKEFKKSPPPEPPIFNYVSSVENPITWHEFYRLNLPMTNKYPFSNAIWYTSVIFSKSTLIYQLWILILHLLPAALIDGLAMCVGKKPKMLKLYRKVHKFSSVLSYFVTREILFCNRRTRGLWDSTNTVDQQLFPFSMSTVEWSDYFEHYLLGIRRYLFKESDDTLPRARIKWKRLYYLHQIVKLCFYFLALYILWSVLSTIF